MSSLCWAKNGVFIWESGPLHQGPDEHAFFGSCEAHVGVSCHGHFEAIWGFMEVAGGLKNSQRKNFLLGFFGSCLEDTLGHFGPCRGHVGAMLGLCVTHVGLMLVHVVEVISFVSSRLDVFLTKSHVCTW